MVCFHAAHYLAFFRRILIKFDYLEADYKTLDADLREMNSEITHVTEWVCFNDTSISTLKDNWFGLISQMVEMASYPTILFYEKLDENDNYKTSAGFNLNDRDLSDL